MSNKMIASIAEELRILRDRCLKFLKQGRVSFIAIIAVLAVFVLLAAAFIYVDPKGNITSRPSRVEHLAVYDATYDSASLKWEASPLANRYIVYRSRL